MPKSNKERRRFFGLFPGRSNSFAPPARTDDGGAVNAALLAGVIASDPGLIDDDRRHEDSPSRYDHPISEPHHSTPYHDSPSHYDHSGGSSGGYGSSDSGGWGGGGSDSGGSSSSDGGGGGD